MLSRLLAHRPNINREHPDTLSVTCSATNVAFPLSLLRYHEALRLAKAQLSVFSTEERSYFRLRQYMYLNAHDAARVLVLATAHFFPRARTAGFDCEFHPTAEPTLHECERLIYCWYWYKLYVISYHAPRDGLRRALDQELSGMGFLQLVVYSMISRFLSNHMDRQAMEDLGIEDPDHDQRKLGTNPVSNWDDALSNFNDVYLKSYLAVEKWYSPITGFCDMCNGEGNCKPRGPGLGLWD